MSINSIYPQIGKIIASTGSRQFPRRMFVDARRLGDAIDDLVGFALVPALEGQRLTLRIQGRVH